MQLEQPPQSSVFSRRLKAGREPTEMTPRERERKRAFQTRAETTEKARSPTVDSCDVVIVLMLYSSKTDMLELELVRENTDKRAQLSCIQYDVALAANGDHG